MTKGISAIIATIMLLMITVALIGVFYVFSSTLATTTTSSGSEQVSQLTKQFTMCMRIDNINGNKVDLRNCGKGVIENKSLVVTMDDTKLGASALTINEGESGTVNVSGLWQIPPGKHNLKISNGATFALALVDVQPNKDGLVGSWNFNEGSENKANDGSGNGNVGTLLPAGSEPVWTSGKFNKGLWFDGTNDYVNVGNGASLSPSDSITIAGWVYLRSGGNNHFDSLPITKGWTYTSLGFENSITPRQFSQFRTSVNGLLNIYGDTVASLNNWHYSSLTFDGQTVRIYLDGKQTATRPATGTITYNNGADWWIGANNFGGYSFGTIDEVRIWNRALAPDETAGMKQLI